jgi:hypothetical protein
MLVLIGARLSATAKRLQRPTPSASSLWTMPEWIYLRNEKTGQWLARRTPRHPEVRKDSFWQALLTEILNPFP